MSPVQGRIGVLVALTGIPKCSTDRRAAGRGLPGVAGRSADDRGGVDPRRPGVARPGTVLLDPAPRGIEEERARRVGPEADPGPRRGGRLRRADDQRAPFPAQVHERLAAQVLDPIDDGAG